MTRCSFLGLFIILSCSPLSAQGIRITDVKGDIGCRDPVFSPDGTKIAFSSNKIGYTNIWVMDVNGKRQKQITKKLRNSSAPAWSPDGKKIAFQSYGIGPKDAKKNIWLFDIFVVNIDGTDLRQLTNAQSLGERAQHPCWSPDGKQMVFTRDARLWVMDSDGKNQFPFTPLPANKWERCCDWSPKEDTLAYIAVEEVRKPWKEYRRIWLIGLNRENQRRFSQETKVEDVQWSKNGQYFYYSTHPSLWKIKADGSEPPMKVLDWGPIFDSGRKFDISPDEQWAVLDDSGHDNEGNIYKYRLNSGITKESSSVEK